MTLACAGQADLVPPFDEKPLFPTYSSVGPSATIACLSQLLDQPCSSDSCSSLSIGVLESRSAMGTPHDIDPCIHIVPPFPLHTAYCLPWEKELGFLSDGKIFTGLYFRISASSSPDQVDASALAALYHRFTSHIVVLETVVLRYISFPSKSIINCSILSCRETVPVGTRKIAGDPNEGHQIMNVSFDRFTA